jgi:hypothetical protein
MRPIIAAAVIAAALLHTSAAHAVGGNYVIDGGTRAERKLVVSALNVSSFNWSVVADRVTIHIAPGVDSSATRGDIWLDSRLLDAGRFAWGIVQHEYAHQVDFFLFDDAIHAELLKELGGVDWCNGVADLPHADYGCERFASTLAWTYWPSPNNCLRPAMAGDESAAMKPARFKALMRSIFSRLDVRG